VTRALRAQPLVSVTPLLALAVLAACDQGLQIVCAAPSSPAAIVVQPRDSIADTLLVTSAVGTIQDGTYTDSLRPFLGQGSPPPYLVAGGNRAGTYTITVRVPGYVIWQRAGVVVARNSCGLSTSLITARLVPAL
jgi:hypothetical protein